MLFHIYFKINKEGVGIKQTGHELIIIFAKHWKQKGPFSVLLNISIVKSFKNVFISGKC